MKETPILFSTPMVQAILAGRKTQTRRIMNPQPPEEVTGFDCDFFNPCKYDRKGEMYPGPDTFGAIADMDFCIKCPYGKPGDRLWVREKFAPPAQTQKSDAFMFAADIKSSTVEKYVKSIWKPSIHMPRAACRIVLEVLNIRVERLTEIGESEAMAEGITLESQRWFKRTHIFQELWEKIHGEGSWNVNPWVWVVEFKAI